MEAIITQGLTKYYGKILALNNLNLKIEKGRCVGFLGPNGAGKSTTIKILCNLIRPTRGKAYINGYNTNEEATRALKNVGAIVETPEFYSYLTPFEILSYLGKLRGMADPDLKQRILQVLEVVKLSEWANTKIGKFSRGMKQRLGIAQTILHNPPILILDEPALGLDPRGMYEIREIIKAIVKEGKTVFLASHMLHEVQETCDSVALIDKGKLLAYDSIENLESVFKVRKIHVELLRPLEPKQIGKIEKLKNVRVISTEEKSLTISFEGGEAEQAELLAMLVKDLEIPVISFKPSLETLEEVYLQLVKEGN
ncbi:MAG: ABC transporter ATP-binding protein [Candidatus Bathyarchaeota archaeon]|nr:ABC transporter ATP-binding protein [Candidatus Bathyarchaeota archaeon]